MNHGVVTIYLMCILTHMHMQAIAFCKQMTDKFFVCIHHSAHLLRAMIYFPLSAHLCLSLTSSFIAGAAERLGFQYHSEQATGLSIK